MIAVRYDALLFDFDGVLIDSEALGNRHVADWLTAAGYPTTPEDSMRTSWGSPDRSLPTRSNAGSTDRSPRGFTRRAGLRMLA